MYGFVYITTNHINNKKYIGQKKYDNRGIWKNYLGSGVIIKQAIKKYGKENFSKEIIAEAKTKKELDKLERFYIKKYNAVKSNDYYNVAKGGDGGDTTIGMSDERKAENRINRRNASLGKINKGKANGVAKQVICLNTMKIYDTLREAADEYNITPEGISAACKNIISHTAGKDPITGEKMQWRFYEVGKEYKYEPYVPKLKKYNPPNKISIICINTNEKFASISDASKKYNISPSTLGEYLKSKNTSSEWKYCGFDNNGNKLIWKYA